MDLKKYIRDVKNFFKLGILFKDILLFLVDGEVFNYIIISMVDVVKDVDVIVGLDVRGFLFGIFIAVVFKKFFIMVRKLGKLLGKVIFREYDLEYGNNIL